MPPVILVFDGHCNLCSGLVRFLSNVDKAKKIQFIPGQSAEGKALLEKIGRPAPETILVIRGEEIFTESEAVLNILKILPRPWKWFVVFRFLPAGIRNKLYKLIARNRYKWFGQRSTCYLPDSRK